MTSIIFFLVFTLTNLVSPQTSTPTHPNHGVEIEILNGDEIDFNFDIVYKELRKQLHIKSDEAVRSVRLMDGKNVIKAFNAIGSNLVVLPMTDFTAGQTHTLEIKFIDAEAVLLAKITTAE